MELVKIARQRRCFQNVIFLYSENKKVIFFFSNGLVLELAVEIYFTDFDSIIVFLLYCFKRKKNIALKAGHV